MVLNDCMNLTLSHSALTLVSSVASPPSFSNWEWGVGRENGRVTEWRYYTGGLMLFFEEMGETRGKRRTITERQKCNDLQICRIKGIMLSSITGSTD